MRIGAMFPTTEIGGDPAGIRDWAQAVEDLGYDHIFAVEHVLGFRDDPTRRRPAWGLRTGVGTSPWCCSGSSPRSPAGWSW